MRALLALGTGSHSCAHCYLLPPPPQEKQDFMAPSLPALPAPGSSEVPRAPTAFQLLCGSRPARKGSSSGAAGGAPLQLSIPRAIDISGFAEFFPSAEGELGARSVWRAAMSVSRSAPVRCPPLSGKYTAGNKPCAHRPKPSNSSVSCICVLHTCVPHGTWSTGSGCC